MSQNYYQFVFLWSNVESTPPPAPDISFASCGGVKSSGKSGIGRLSTVNCAKHSHEKQFHKEVRDQGLLEPQRLFLLPGLRSCVTELVSPSQ